MAGRVAIEDDERGRRVVVTPDGGSEEIADPVSRRSRLIVEDGQHVEVGEQLVQGSVDPKQVLRILGPRAAQKYLVDEVQDVYASQGVDIHDKHIEVIVRQMLRRITIIDRVRPRCCRVNWWNARTSRRRTAASCPKVASPRLDARN